MLARLPGAGASSVSRAVTLCAVWRFALLRAVETVLAPGPARFNSLIARHHHDGTVGLVAPTKRYFELLRVCVRSR